MGELAVATLGSGFEQMAPLKRLLTRELGGGFLASGAICSIAGDVEG